MSIASKLIVATLALFVTFASTALVVSPYTHAPRTQLVAQLR